MVFKCAFSKCDRKCGGVPPLGLVVSFDRGDLEGGKGRRGENESRMKAERRVLVGHQPTVVGKSPAENL